MRPSRTALVLLLALALALPAATFAPLPGGVPDDLDPHRSKVRAGVGVTDATWHVGAGSGQYTAKEPDALNLVSGGEVDPHSHGTAQRKSYGVQSRLTYRTLVVEGSDGNRIALVKSDSYLAQDQLTRRAAQILAEGDSGITHEQILLQASHNHSSPYYTTPSWGVWLFQDAFDLRAFEYHARQMAASIEAAVADLRPARMGATTVEHTIYKGNIVGGQIADDGTPAGYPDEHQDAGMTVVRFDDVSGPKPEPLAVYVNHGQHPESLDGYDLITADFLAPFERMVERELGATLVFGQGDVGSAEGPYLRENAEVMEDGVYRAWAHVGHAQTERGARYLADSVIDAWHAIGASDDGGEASVAVPFTKDFPVAAVSTWVPGPVSHPYPSVSNCRSETTAEGNPGSPILGLPDCAREGDTDSTNMLWENLKAHGLPLPEHYDAPGYKAVEENARILLQVFRMGEVLLASCSCEAQMDLILNLESRLDDVEGNIFDGYDWGARCTQNEDTTWTCPNPRNAAATLTVPDDRYQRMQAQVHNDARGWDAPGNAVAANSEPSDPAEIWGNFTKEELPEELGYAVAIGVGHAGDYMGYTVSYREYMRGDHYRKALTAYGPHTADYVNTRLVRMAGALKGGPAVEPEPHATALEADEVRAEAEATALGQAAAAIYDAWLAALPDDVGPAAATAQPADITRFDATTFSWRGGSNYVDNPVVRVERQVGQGWEPFADQSGEIQTMVRYPHGAEGIAETWTGSTEWVWTANLEAYSAFPSRLGQTPAGTYRFVVDGHIADGGPTPYQLTSEPFTVSPWDGASAGDVTVDGDGAVSFTAGSTYPRTYESPFRFVADDGRTDVCKTCTFRPWASSAAAEVVTVTVTRAEGGPVERVHAVLADGRWTAPTGLGDGDTATIEPGDLVDANGEVNGERIVLVG